MGPAPTSPYQPTETHRIGLYLDGAWHELRPKAGTYDPADAQQDIDHDIVQRNLIDALLGVSDARDGRIRYVGANHDAGWMQDRVDDGTHRLAITLPAVTMDQFVAVCMQNRLMPPKSTWFVPKIRSGLVVAMLGD